MLERSPLSPVRPWAMSRKATVREVGMSVEQLEACAHGGARHETGQGLEASAHVGAHAAATRRAAGVESRHLAREVLGQVAVGVGRGNSKAHVARFFHGPL